MRRVEAVLVLRELLEGCVGMDGHCFELSAPFSADAGDYQIVVRGALDAKTKSEIETVVARHELACQAGTMWRTRRTKDKAEPDTLIIYRPR